MAALQPQHVVSASGMAIFGIEGGAGSRRPAAGARPRQSVNVTMTSLTHSHSRHGARAAGLSATLRAAGARFAAWRLYRRTLSELSALSPRELNDLGLTPGTVDAAARASVYGSVPGR